MSASTSTASAASPASPAWSRGPARGRFVTVAKTTGSAARVIGPHGEEQPIKRRGAATINEQVDIVRDHVTEAVEALVIECMAVRPLYQEYSPGLHRPLRYHHHHQRPRGPSGRDGRDARGDRGLDVGDDPRNGVLITGESRSHLQEAAPAQRRVTGLAVRLRRPGSRARRGPARLRLPAVQGQRRHRLRRGRPAQHRPADRTARHVEVGHGTSAWCGCSPTTSAARRCWVPMFAANDRESVIATFELLQAYFPRVRR